MTVEAVRRDRDFYMRPTVERSGFWRHPPYISMLHSLAGCYRQMGWLDSAQATEQDAGDLEAVLT